MPFSRPELSPIPDPPAVRLFSRGALFCALLLCICLFLPWPVAEIGINDDWVYVLIARDFARTGHFMFHGWASPMMGWQAMWGALFARVFGFSFTAIRLSDIPIALGTALLFHAILRRCGLNRAHATFGTLTFTLSPVFLPLADTFMTDIPSLFALFVCLYLCQLALASEDDHQALLWLAAAALSNVLLGTVRQIAWLGVLVIVPSCGWLLRRRRHLSAATVGLWIASALCIRALLHWFAHQPYTAPEKLIPRAITKMAFYNIEEYFWRAAMTTLILCLPVLATGLAAVWPLRKGSAIRLGAALLAFGLLCVHLRSEGNLAPYDPPWTGNIATPNGIMQAEGLFGSVRQVPLLDRSLLLAFFVVCVLAFAEAMFARRTRLPAQADVGKNTLSWHDLSILLLPFLAAYWLLLLPRAAFFSLFDRYMLEVVAVLLIFLLRWHQEHLSRRIPATGVAVLALFAIVAAAGTHDLFAMDRARVRLIGEVEQNGVPRTAIRGGFAFDAVTQAEGWGYLNDPRIQSPRDAFRPQPELSADRRCLTGFEPFVPAVQARVAISADPDPCIDTASFPSVTYRTWLPPGRRELSVGILRKFPNPGSGLR